jgi:hypothetical protein
MNTSLESECSNNHILVIDDNPAIHQDFRKILSPIDSELEVELDADEASLFGDAPPPPAPPRPRCRPRGR